MKKTVCLSLGLILGVSTLWAQPVPKLDNVPNAVDMVAGTGAGAGALVGTSNTGKTDTPSQNKSSAVPLKNPANVNGLMISNTSISPTIAPVNSPVSSTSLYSGFSKEVLASQPNRSSYFQNSPTCSQTGITRSCN